MSAPAAARACTATEASAPNVASKAQLPPEVLFPVSSKVEALDEAGTWYEAKVVDERGQGAAREYLVHYNGWKARYDEWVGAGSGRLRAAGSGELGPCKRFAAAAKMETGSRVEARDPRGAWYAAKLEDQRGHGTARELLVHYNGWNKRLDEWIGVCSGRLRAVDGKLEPSKSEVSHVEGDGQRRSASAPKTCAGDEVTAAACAPSAPPPDAIDPTHSQTLEEPPASLVDQWLAVPTEHFGILSLGMRAYLAKVFHEENDQVFFWLVVDGNEHCAPRAAASEWVLPAKEIAKAVKGMVRTSPPKQTRAPESVPAPAAAVARTAAATAPRPARAPAAAATAAPSSEAAPKQPKRPAEAVDSADDLIGRWVGIPAEHFQESGGGRYLGHVTSRRGKSDSVWFKCEGGEYHDHYTKVREWLISDEERTAVEWCKDSMDTEGVERAARTQESRESTRSRADEQRVKRSRPHTARVRASTPAAAHREDFGAGFDGGVDLDEAQPVRAHGRQRKAAGRQSKEDALKDGWKGKPISKGAAGELFYTQLCVKGENFHVGDTVCVQGSSDPDRPWLCRIDSFWESTSGERLFEGRWYWHPEETCAGRLQGHDSREIFQTEHCTEPQEVEVIDSPCHVLSWDVFQEWLDQPSTGGDDEHTYICRASYHPGTGEFRPLVGASSLAEAVRVSVGGGYEESAFSQAEVPAPALQRKARLSRFAQAAERLTPSAAPERMPGREKELEEVTCSLRGAICEGTPTLTPTLTPTPTPTQPQP